MCEVCSAILAAALHVAIPWRRSKAVDVCYGCQRGRACARGAKYTTTRMPQSLGRVHPTATARSHAAGLEGLAGQGLREGRVQEIDDDESRRCRRRRPRSRRRNSPRPRRRRAGAIDAQLRRSRPPLRPHRCKATAHASATLPERAQRPHRSASNTRKCTAGNTIVSVPRSRDGTCPAPAFKHPCSCKVLLRRRPHSVLSAGTETTSIAFCIVPWPKATTTRRGSSRPVDPGRRPFGRETSSCDSAVRGRRRRRFDRASPNNRPPDARRRRRRRGARRRGPRPSSSTVLPCQLAWSISTSASSTAISGTSRPRSGKGCVDAPRLRAAVQRRPPEATPLEAVAERIQEDLGALAGLHERLRQQRRVGPLRVVLEDQPLVRRRPAVRNEHERLRRAAAAARNSRRASARPGAPGAGRGARRRAAVVITF